MSLIRRDAPLPKSRTGPGRVPTGVADEVTVSDASFRALHRGYERSAAAASNAALHAGQPPAKKRKREDRGDSSIVYGADSYKGPWRKFEEYRPDAAADDSDAESDVEIEEIYEEDELEEQPARPTTKSLAGTAYSSRTDAAETSAFHGAEERDYMGRTYMHVPQDLGINLLRDESWSERTSFIPKREIHVFGGKTAGHAEGRAITATRFFPGSGHLLLSGAADSKILLWDVYHQRSLLRSFDGHKKAITDLDFAPDGASFLSAAFDRSLKLWDTETGQCTWKTSGATPHVARLNPSSPHEFIAGMSDNKIVQHDVRAEGTKPVQEYDHHLGPVNTLTFCDADRRFASTSDDKSLRAWEWGIPVPIKLVAEPGMYSMVRSAMHPSQKHMLFQSMDNTIVVYAAGDKFRQNRKKAFRGHNTAGSSCGIAVSPDGQFVASGDTGGKVFFWDFKTCKVFSELQVSKGGVNTVAWHPQEKSRVVTGGTDGKLKYWD